MGAEEIKGSNVVTLVIVEWNPGRTTSAYSDEFTFKIEGNRLLLRTVRPAPGVWTAYVQLQ